jgi:hypothetical protein
MKASASVIGQLGCPECAAQDAGAWRPKRCRVRPQYQRHLILLRRSVAWLFGYHRLSIRYDRYANHFCAFLTLAATLTCYKKLHKAAT